MSYKKLPKGAKLTGKWEEVSAEAIPTGWSYDEITKVTYQAEVTYNDGMKAYAVMVELYHDGNRKYRQAFYGETAESDAERESRDELNKLSLTAPVR
jgi:hypothetical protein